FFYTLGLLLVSSPIFIIFIFGPKANKSRLVYLCCGFGMRGFVAGLQYLLMVEERLSGPFGEFLANITSVSVAAILEEIIRYPSIILAQYLGLRFMTSDIEIMKSEEIVDVDWMEREDPHGMGMYFGLGWGFAETIGFYFSPSIQDFMNEVNWEAGIHILAISVYVTGVMAHIALTYIAMVISVNRGFYRFTIGLHVVVNIVNETFTAANEQSVLSANEESNLLMVLFTRFSIVLCAYFLLRPRARYLSPAVLLFLQVLMFIGFVIIGTFIFLLTWLWKNGLPEYIS
ncbi:MAG: hypothetical protein ACXADH_16680, partial [Candidatus Kariarchaeaceae archaeon]